MQLQGTGNSTNVLQGTQGGGTSNVQTAGALNYIGNPDFRGYLNYLASTGNTNARNMINSNIGNDANWAGGGTTTNAQSLYKQYLGLTGANTSAGNNAPIINIPGPYIPPSAPYIDTNAIMAASKNQAASQTNPYYDKLINQYLQQEAANTAAKQSETEASIKNTQAQLANQLQGTELSRQQTEQNTALNVANINRQQQDYQKQQGLEGEQNIRGLQENIGQSGMAGSGIGTQQVEIANQDRAIKEAAQEGQYTYSRNQQDLFKNQTFAQLANTDAANRLKEQEGENTANFSLADYLRQAKSSEFQFQTQNEQNRQQAILQAQNDLYRQNIINTIAKYKNNLPLYSAAYSAYVR